MGGGGGINWLTLCTSKGSYIATQNKAFFFVLFVLSVYSSAFQLSDCAWTKHLLHLQSIFNLISFEGERLFPKKHVSACDRRIISLSQIFAGQVGVISVATVT